MSEVIPTPCHVITSTTSIDEQIDDFMVLYTVVFLYKANFVCNEKMAL
jgi:hypothetical protein